MEEWGGRGAQGLVALTLAEYGDLCHLCMERGATSADHLLPRSLGGDDSLENLRPAHKLCNSRRGARSIAWFRAKYAPHLLSDLARVDNVADFLAAASGHLAPARPVFFGSENAENAGTTSKKADSDLAETLAFFTDRNGS